MGDGVIYGVHIARPEADGPMRAGPVVTFCARLPDWVVLDPETELKMRAALHTGMQAAMDIVTKSEKSDANRRAILAQVGRSFP